jgi:putative ABC transport system permease protein
MRFKEIAIISLKSLIATKLRTFLTVAIIAFGIMALMLIITATKAMEQKFTESFSNMGASGFNIRFKERKMRFNNNGTEITKTKKNAPRQKKSNLGQPISVAQAEWFKNNYKFPAQVSINRVANFNAIIGFNSKKTNPNVRVMGSDENYININNYTLVAGRNLNTIDIETGRNVCMIGYTIAKKLFDNKKPFDIVDNFINIEGMPYRVIGCLKEKGSSFGFSLDNLIVTSYNNAKQNFNGGILASYNISVKAKDIQQVEGAIGEAKGIFRPIRRLTVTDEDNFYIDKSDSMASMVIGGLKNFTIAAAAIGLITLISSAIALMNIMLVSVNERTKEIGLVKAIGGTKLNIRWQFLLESVFISLAGALLGIILGVLIGNIASLLMHTSFIIPWVWVVRGVLMCSLVGFAAGFYPAFKASKLNPIAALRHD